MIIIVAQSNAAEKQSEAYPMNTPLVKWARSFETTTGQSYARLAAFSQKRIVGVEFFDKAFPESAPPPPDPTVSECMAEIMRLNALVEDLRKAAKTAESEALKRNAV